MNSQESSDLTDVKRLDEIEQRAQRLVGYGDMSGGTKRDIVDPLVETIRQQQAEIERLNRAYEVLKGTMEGYAIQLNGARTALEEAQRIKDGEQQS